MPEAVIVSAARSPIGRAGKGSLKEMRPDDLTVQMVQAALTGQGVVLARSSLVSDSLASGDLVEVLPTSRMDSPMSYWLIAGPRSVQRPEIRAFCDWLQLQAVTTRETIGEVPDPDTVDDID